MPNCLGCNFGGLGLWLWLVTEAAENNNSFNDKRRPRMCRTSKQRHFVKVNTVFVQLWLLLIPWSNSHPPENYDSDTESASETWPIRQEEESESQSQTGSQSRTEVHMSRKERFLAGQQTSPVRMLTPQQAQDMAHWESSRSPQVTLERMRLSGSARESSPFNPKMFSTDYVPKRGPGRPVKRRRWV